MKRAADPGDASTRRSHDCCSPVAENPCCRHRSTHRSLQARWCTPCAQRAFRCRRGQRRRVGACPSTDVAWRDSRHGARRSGSCGERVDPCLDRRHTTSARPRGVRSGVGHDVRCVGDVSPLGSRTQGEERVAARRPCRDLRRDRRIGYADRADRVPRRDRSHPRRSHLVGGADRRLVQALTVEWRRSRGRRCTQ